MAKFIFSLGDGNFRLLATEAKTRDITIQELIRAVIIPDWMKLNLDSKTQRGYKPLGRVHSTRESTTLDYSVSDWAAQDLDPPTPFFLLPLLPDGKAGLGFRELLREPSYKRRSWLERA